MIQQLHYKDIILAASITQMISSMKVQTCDITNLTFSTKEDFESFVYNNSKTQN